MDIKSFRSKIRLDSKIIIDDREFSVREIIKFRLDDGGFYIKCFLSDGYVLADDLSENIFILVKDIKNDFKPPFPNKLKFDNKEFKFLYTAHAIAEEVWGEKIFEIGESESFWDFQASDGSYLSLGITDKNKERLDFLGKVLKPEQINLA